MTPRILLNIEITPNCPARCTMCPRDLVSDNGFMSLATAREIAGAVGPDMAWELDLAGRGEPTIHPKFADVAAVFRQTGIPLGVVTTGVQFTERNIELTVGLFNIIRISVSSVKKDVFDKVHVGLDHGRIWRNIAALAPLAADKTVVHLTGGPAIYDTLPRTVDRLRELGYRRFRLLTLWNRGGHYETREARARRLDLMESLAIPPSENEAWAGVGQQAFFEQMAQHRKLNPRYCPIGSASLSIAWDGRVLGCFQDFGHTSIVGHLADMDLRSHLLNRTTEMGRMPVCEKCDAHKVTHFDTGKD